MSRAYRGLVIGLLAIVTCSAFEAMAVTTAMPVVAANLGGQRSYGLAFSLYLTASLAATAAAGSWSDRAGPRPSLLTGLLLMCGGLLLCGGAWDFTAFTIGRMVSGAGAGFMIVPVYVIIGQALPSVLQPIVFGWFSAAWVVPSLVGPYVSGLLAEHVSWRWAFFGVVPIVVVAVLLMWPRIKSLGAPEEKSMAAGEGRRRAFLGAGLAAGVAVAQWAAQSSADPGMRAAVTPVALALLGAVGLAGVVLTVPRLLPPGSFRVARGLPAVVVVRGLLTLAFFGAEAFVPLMLVDRYGLEPSIAGLALTGGALGWTLGSFAQAKGWLPRPAFLVVGPAVVAASMGGVALVVLVQAPPLLLASAWAVAGMGMGLATSTTSVLVLELSDAAERGRNSASLQLADMLGGVIGTAGAGTLYSLMLTPNRVPGPGAFALLVGALAISAFLSGAAGSRTSTPSPAVREADRA
ncbi:MFS transporter [Sinomonas humi]|uniref:MFS transporter n=1 Tax=Sinomonas humi TaxID=1338436 RepID=UPI00068AF7D7|nr:MFS transporter [Sinomonas humi]